MRCKLVSAAVKDSRSEGQVTCSRDPYLEDIYLLVEEGEIERKNQEVS